MRYDTKSLLGMSYLHIVELGGGVENENVRTARRHFENALELIDPIIDTDNWLTCKEFLALTWGRTVEGNIRRNSQTSEFMLREAIDVASTHGSTEHKALLQLMLAATLDNPVMKQSEEIRKESIKLHRSALNLLDVLSKSSDSSVYLPN